MAMTLAFPNPSRSFDAARNAVLFVGHDGLFEIRFMVEAAALSPNGTHATAMSEDQYLSAFDEMLGSIQSVAREVYSRHRRNSNTLTVADFK